VYRLNQRAILKVSGLMGNVWEDHHAAEAYLCLEHDGGGYEYRSGWTNWETLQAVLKDAEISKLDFFAEVIKAAEKLQEDVCGMVGARYVDSHPEEYPMRQDPRDF
jgi:hypothetical protein